MPLHSLKLNTITEKTKDVRLIDFDNIGANDWMVTNQFPIDGKPL